MTIRKPSVQRFDSIRAIFAIAACWKMNLCQFDIKTAFLYGELEETIFMRQPTGYNDGTNRVCKLKHGLKQSSRCWNEHFTDSINKFQLKATKADPCVFTSGEGESRLFLAIYIDDGLIAATDERQIISLLQELKSEFEITIGTTDAFLGLHIEKKENGNIFIHQEAYTNCILERFRMQGANPVAIPADRQHEALGANSKEAVNVPYRQAIGILCSCP